MSTVRRVRTLSLLGGVVALYLALPLFFFALRLVTSPRRGFHQAGLYSALRISLEGATISLALVTIFGLPLAYVLARSSSRLASIVGVVVQLPLALPPLMSGIILIYVVGPYTWLGRLFARHLTNSMFGVVLAMTFVSAPFLIVAARSSFATLDQGLFDVATTLGHGEVSKFWRVALPTAREGVRAGMVLAWLRAFGEYGAVIVLAYNPTSLPIYTYNQFSGLGLSTTLAPTALALAVALGVVGLSRLAVARTHARVAPLGEGRGPVPVAARAVAFDVVHQRATFHLEVAYRGGARHVAILGPSGAGKSLLLRCLAGLEGAPTNALILKALDHVSPPSGALRVGYVAQGFALFPHLRVRDQLLFARGASVELAAYWSERLGLRGLEGRLPQELSGGQRQRVALAQVLCASPDVLILDEPFSALDAPVRLELRRELRRLQSETGLASVLVTHDPEEAALLADEVLVLGEGRELQSGTSRELFARPKSREVARLLGVANLLNATVVTATQLEVADQRLAILPTPIGVGRAVAWSVRPERVVVSPLETSALEGALRGTLVDVADVGTAYDLFVTLGQGVELQARVTDAVNVAIGEECRVLIASDAISLWALEAPSLETPLAPSR